ncbi:MAG: hypothetical protein GEEBNDBF_01714 [bacterium]|nr:hypothetical protein [bacterium]
MDGNLDLWPHKSGWGVVANDFMMKNVTVASTPLSNPGYTDWTYFILESPPAASVAPSVGIVLGRAAVAYFDNTNQRLRLARQVTTDIERLQDWRRTTVAFAQGNEGRYWVPPLVLELNGRIAIFWCEPTTTRLRYALADSAY